MGRLAGDPSCFKPPENWLPVVPSEEKRICLCCLLRLYLESEYLMSPFDYADGSQVPVRGGYQELAVKNLASGTLDEQSILFSEVKSWPMRKGCNHRYLIILISIKKY